MYPELLMTDEEVPVYLAKNAETLASRPIKARHALATIGSVTVNSGKIVTASTGTTVRVNGANLRLACVGDVVRYVDGSENRIISGAGRTAMYKDKPFAMTGSFLDNGDMVVTSLQASVFVVEYADGSRPDLLYFDESEPCPA